MGDCHDCPVATLPPPPRTRRHIVAIVGPPNSGKSTLFNRLTGLRQKVANFPGVTVEHRMGRVKLDADREVYRGGSAGRLQPESAHGRRARHARRTQRHDEGHAEAGRGAADSRFHESEPPPGAGRAGSESGPADAGDPEHGRRSGRARRRDRFGGAGHAARLAGRAGERGEGGWRRQGFSVSGRVRLAEQRSRSR